ncbi:MAG TPA: hypothetical protein VMZ91_02015 [Candidatus Paceibacterota bacterium]|nr:hypothetical protein [Candidatus Paceibacterota bacterium]
MINDSIPTKDTLTREIKKYVSQTAQHKNPNVTANAMYFIIKQHNSSIKSRKTYISIFKKVKEMLVESFDWRMIEIHKCFCELNKLMGYIKKKD